MNNVLFLIFCLLMVNLQSFSQNLVPNPSFEQYDTCPNNYSQIVRASGWYSPTTGTPDYLNACSAFNGIKVLKIYGETNLLNWKCIRWSDYLVHGWRFKGIYTGKLSSTLITGKTYSVSFYVSLPDSQNSACNNIGAYLSQSAIGSTGSYVLPMFRKYPTLQVIRLLINTDGH